MESIKKAVETGQIKKIDKLVEDALAAGAQPLEILDAMVAAMDYVGELFQRNEMYVPEMLVSALTMKKGVEVLKPALGDASAAGKGKFIIGTVAGDLHDIGKNLVALMVESAGFEVIDLGADVPPQRFVEALQANPDCKIVGLSALLTTTMSSMADTVNAIKEAGLRENISILIGGAPVSTAFATEIGADHYAPDAAAAAALAKDLA